MEKKITPIMGVYTSRKYLNIGMIFIAEFSLQENQKSSGIWDTENRGENTFYPTQYLAFFYSNGMNKSWYYAIQYFSLLMELRYEEPAPIPIKLAKMGYHSWEEVHLLRFGKVES